MHPLITAAELPTGCAAAKVADMVAPAPKKVELKYRVAKQT